MRERNYLCVFRADPDIDDDVVDLGQDPDFSPPVPTWGICRPQVRARWVSVGSHVVFVGYDPERDTYLLKGWFRVGEIITYPEALQRFPNRRNVIIRLESKGLSATENVAWKRRTVRCQVEDKYGSTIPEFLRIIRSGSRTYVQNPEDDHAADNWKCQRIFLCSEERLLDCIEAGRCIREEEFSSLKGYVVADPKDCQDVGPMRIEWSTVGPSSLLSRPLRTPLGQHNAMRLRDSDIEELRANVLQPAGG